MEEQIAPAAVPHQSTRRTIATKFVLENFKSYAGVREIGPMHKRFLAVVGPNGSGKSNLIDAMLFIFGKRAKKLRMKNLSSLIHNSAEHPDVKEARVEIHFCEIDDADPVTASAETDAYNVIPGSEFVLARTVRLDNTTFYSLNGKRQTFEEVEGFMRTRGIDINNNRFLILQGEVEAISMMKPKGENKHEEGMLEFLEELIGTDKYVEEIEKAQALVEVLSASRAVKLEQVKVGEKEMAALEGPKDEAMRFRFLETSLAEGRCKIMATRLKQCEERCTEAEKINAEVSESFGNKRKELEAIGTQVAVLDEEYKTQKEVHAQIVKALEEHKETYAKYERKHIKDEAKAKQLAAKVEKNEAALANARKTKEQEALIIAKLEKELPVLTSTSDQAQTTLQEAEAVLEQIRSESKEEARVIREEIEVKQVELAPLAAELREIESDVHVVEKEIALLEGPSTEAKKALPEATKLVGDFKQQLSGFPAQIKEAEAKVAEVRVELVTSDATIEELKQNESASETDVVSLSSSVRSAQVNTGASKKGSIVKRLMEAIKPGEHLEGCGLVGRLGDLGTVPEELDCAATTAAGNALDSLVARTAEDAEKCVSFLRTEKLGVATFIILDKMSKVSPSSTSLPAPRLIDQVTPVSEEIRPAFYHVFRDTLYCTDLDEATKVAFDSHNVCRHRVVTLKGELIDRSGTMSGGGKPRKGGFSGTPDNDGISEKELKELTVKLSKAESALAEYRTAITKETKLRAKMEKVLQQREDVLMKLKRDAETMEHKLKKAEFRVAELTASIELSADDSKTLGELQHKLAKLIPKRDKAHAAAGKVESALEELATALNEVGGTRGKQARMAVERARLDLDNARAALTRAQVALESARAALTKAELDSEKLGGELELALAEQEMHENERKRTEDKATEAQARYEEAKTREATALAELEAKKSEWNSCKAELKRLESSSVEMRLKMESAEEELRKAVARRAKWQSELETARTRLEEWREAAKEDAPTDNSEPTNPNNAVTEAETLSETDVTRLENELQRLENEAKSLRGNVNMGAIADYRAREKEYLEKVKELDEASLARDQARAQCDELKKKRLVEFMHGFSIISLKLKEIYQLITLGGDAELELVDSLDPFSEGVVFSVRPPKKSWKNISNLSGGEKTLSSLSLVFALHAFRGAPIYVMDEIDAALDFKNVSIVANYIKERTKNAQFLIISLRNNMFELADRLVGVYKTNNATKTVTINPDRVALRSGIAEDDQDNQNKQAGSTKLQKTPSSFTAVRGVLTDRDENAVHQ